MFHVGICVDFNVSLFQEQGLSASLCQIKRLIHRDSVSNGTNLEGRNRQKLLAEVRNIKVFVWYVTFNGQEFCEPKCSCRRLYINYNNNFICKLHSSGSSKKTKQNITQYNTTYITMLTKE